MSYLIEDWFNSSIQITETKALSGSTDADVHQFSLSVQKDLPYDLNLSVAHTYVMGIRLLIHY